MDPPHLAPVIIVCIVVMVVSVGVAYFIIRRRARANDYQVNGADTVESNGAVETVWSS